MAYDQQQYRSSSQISGLGLAFSHSYLDGVPFKISSAFRAPHQPELPQELLSVTPSCDALHDEYEYETEEGVLAWARAREEAKAKAIAERETTERAKAALALAADESSSSGSEEEVPGFSQKSAATITALELTISRSQVVKPPWQLPAAASVNQAILTPIQAAKAKVQSPMTPKAQVDLALFEQEGDPFDNLELQTINEMEELRTLLGEANIGGTHQEQSSSVDELVAKDSSEQDKTQIVDTELTGQQEPEGHSDMAFSANHLYVNVVPGPSGLIVCDGEQPGGSNITEGSLSNVTDGADLTLHQNSSFTAESTGDGDYVQIRPDYSQQTAIFQRNVAPIYSNIGPESVLSVGGKLPEEYANSWVFKPVLPAIRPREHSLGAEQAVEEGKGVSESVPLNSASHSSILHINGKFGVSADGMTQNSNGMSTSASGVLDVPRTDFSLMNQNHIYSNMQDFISKPEQMNSSLAFTNNIYGNSAAGSAIKSTSSDRQVLRSAKSNPDLSLTGHSPQHTAVNSSPQSWAPCKPLPPPPVTEQRSSSSSTESLSAEHHPVLSPSLAKDISTASSSEPPEADPYNNLSNEAKTFVNNLTSMGFLRSRASRAVQKFGADEKEVLDHLLNVDKLVEKKFTPAQAETGLQLFKNDIKKAEQFLDLYQQFTELGFTGDRIQAALVKHQLDRDKALDYLTA